MTCRELTDFLREAVDGELPAEIQAVFEQHLSRCHNCVAFFAQYRVTIQASQHALDEPAAVPDELVGVILQAIRRARADGL